MMRRPLTLLLILAATLLAGIHDHIERARKEWRDRPEAGYTNETVVVTALLVAAAIVVITTIIGKVTTKAKSIDLGP
jgi:hypothetical protein